MTGHEWLAEQFETNRSHLQAVAYRMLGSTGEAADAVQETWLRLSRADTGEVENLRGWLTTVTARICLDILRARRAHREESLDALTSESTTQTSPEPIAQHTGVADPEQEALLADAVGLALLVILDRLAPAERLAFVLHDMFALPFDEIAPIVDRTPTATRQLASRARRRVQGADVTTDAQLAPQRQVVDAFLAAARHGDFDALLTLLDPDVVLRMDAAAVPSGVAQEMRGATKVATMAMRGRARAAQPALVDGAVGVVVAPRGRLMMVLRFTITDGKIVAMESVADPERLDRLDLAMLAD